MAEGDGEGQITGAHCATPDVFISYASQDAAHADAIVAALEEQGLKCWIAPRDVTPGEFYAGSIVHAIDAAKATVLILSQNSAASPHVVREVERAASKRHPVISLRIDKAPLPADLEYFLNTSQWLDASGGAPARVMPKLVAAVRFAIDKPLTPETAIGGTPMRASHAAGDGRSQRRKAIVAGSAVIVAIAGFAGYRSWQFTHQATALATGTAPTSIPAAPAIPDKSVAVLPFVDMSEKKDQEYFSDGLSEELIDHLSQTQDLKVIARTSSFQFKGKNEDMRAIGQKLGVANLLEGSVRTSGKTLRVTAQLIKVADGSHLWSQTYDRKFDDIFKIQDEIAGSVVQALKVSLLQGRLRKASGAENVEAFNLYLQARELYRQGQGGVTGEAAVKRADDYVQQVLRMEPSFAPAWSLLYAIRSNQVLFGFVQKNDGRKQAREAAERAIALDPDSAEAQLNRADIYMDEWNWDDANACVQRALQIDPNSARTLGAASYMAFYSGHPEQAIALIQRAVALDPLNAGEYRTLSYYLRVARQFSEAEAALHKATDLNPKLQRAHVFAGLIMLERGELSLALAEFEHEPNLDNSLFGKALAYHALGKRAESDAALAELEQKYAHMDPVNIAEVYAFRGQADQAFAWLDRAYDSYDPDLWWIKTDPLFRELRSDSRFKSMLRKIHLSVT